MTTVAAIIPTIPGREELCERAIASVTAQTRPVDKILVGLDEDGQGPAYARNALIAQADTDWVAMLDDDDTWYPNHIEALLSHTDEADVIYPWFDGLHAHDIKVTVGLLPKSPLGVPFGPEQAAHLRHQNFIPVTFMARTSMVLEVGGFEKPWWLPPTSPCEDWGLLLKLQDAGARFCHHPAVTWTWHGHAGQTNGQPIRQGVLSNG